MMIQRRDTSARSRLKLALAAVVLGSTAPDLGPGRPSCDRATPGRDLSHGLEGQANFAQGIIDLANAGAKVINDDVIFFAEPFFQDGIASLAVNTVKGMGVAYFSSAGDDGRQAYESPFRPSGQSLKIGAGPEEAHDFDPGTGVDTRQQLTIPVGSTLTLVYQWDQPFFSVSGPPGSASDMDIVLTNAACDTLVDGSSTGNIGVDPFEVFSFANPGPTTTFGVIILRDSGPNPGLMKFVNAGGGAVRINEFDTKTGTSWGAIAPYSEGSVSARPITGKPRLSIPARRSSRRSRRSGHAHPFRHRREPARHAGGSPATGHHGAGLGPTPPSSAGVTRTRPASRTSSGPRLPPRMPPGSPP